MLLRTYAQRLAPLLYAGQQRTPFHMTELMMQNAFRYQYDKTEWAIYRRNRVLLIPLLYEVQYVLERNQLLFNIHLSIMSIKKTFVV